MKLEGEYLFNGPRDQVWKLVRDPEVLSTALPGTQSLNKISDAEFQGVMHLKIGPMAGNFSGKLMVSDEIPPESCTLTVEGKGAPGSVKGTGHVQLIEQADGRTLMKYTGDLQVSGTLASTGQRMIEPVSKSMVKQGLETLNKALEARMEAKQKGSEVEYKPPTEAEFAGAVAKDVGRNLTSIPEVRMVMYIVPAIALLIILALVLSRCGA
jgi:carbon monoxide dehydrogenase subunit G